MKNNKNDNGFDQSRRELLKGMSTAAVVGGVIASGISTSINAEPSAPDTQPNTLKKGYHETQHVRDYFDSL